MDIALNQSVNDSTQHREWVYYPGSFEPLAIIKDDGLYVYHNDPNGLPTHVLNPDGKVVWSARYDAIGKMVSLPFNEVDNPLRMQGSIMMGKPDYIIIDTGILTRTLVHLSVRTRWVWQQVRMFMLMYPMCGYGQTL